MPQLFLYHDNAPTCGVDDSFLLVDVALENLMRFAIITLEESAQCMMR